MPPVRHATSPGNPNSASYRGAVRYRFEQARHFAQRSKRRFGRYRGNFPQAAAKRVEDSAFSFSVKRCLEGLFRCIITYCLQHTEHGYLLSEDLRSSLKTAGVSRSNVTTYVNRLLGLGLLIHVADDVYRIQFYNCGTQQRQDELVQKLDGRRAKKQVKTSTYKAQSPYTSRAKALRVCKDLAAPSKTKTKNTLPTVAPASSDGIGPHIMPAAKQGGGRQAVVLPQKTAPALPSVSSSTQPEKPPRDAQSIERMLVDKLPKGFAIPNLGQKIIERRDDPMLAPNSPPSVSEAEARGHRAANIAEREKWELVKRKAASRQKRQPLAPISHATATFMDTCYDMYDDLQRRFGHMSGNVLSRPKARGTNPVAGPLGARSRHSHCR